MLRGIRSVPGVESAGLTDALPLGQNYGWRTWGLQAKGKVYERGQTPQALVRMIDEGYLDAMKIPIRLGRNFTASDNSSSEPVILINEALARTLWPGEDPLGRILWTSNVDRRVVGVVGGVRYFGPEQDAELEMYMPIRETPGYLSVDLVVRSERAVKDLAPVVRAVLRNLDPSLPVADFRTMPNCSTAHFSRGGRL